jgi:hypothetical protein
LNSLSRSTQAAFDDETESEFGLLIDDIDAIVTLFKLIPLMWRGLAPALALEANAALLEVN